MAEHFYKLRVAEIVPETDEANSIRFEVQLPPRPPHEWVEPIQRADETRHHMDRPVAPPDVFELMNECSIDVAV